MNISGARNPNQTEPNQALEPTIMLVTDRAYARSAPSMIAAHL